jgi:nucleolar protein 56
MLKMKAYIVRNPVGVFGVDEKRKLIDKVLFKKEPAKVAKKILSGDVLDEEKQVIESLKKKGYKKFVFSKKISSYPHEENNEGEKFIRSNLRKIAKDKGLSQYLTEVGIQLTRIRIKETVKKDKIVVQSINTLDEIDKSINIFVERLREWYGLHFPEFEKSVDNHEKFVKIITESGLRENIKDKEFAKMAEKSMGLDLDKKDGEMLKMYANNIGNLYKMREKMEKYIESVMKDIAPNFTELAGALLGARLIALVGGMDKLAKKPSSTIQLLGSEKALFRHLRGKGRAPKHGILFQSPYIQHAHPSKRGKIARILSSKLSIALKVDYYGSKDMSKKMKKELEEIIKKASED